MRRYGHISVWFDAEAYNGRGVESEHKELTEALAELPVEPCENCAMITRCGIKATECKAFRNYASTGKYASDDIGRLMREIH